MDKEKCKGHQDHNQHQLDKWSIVTKDGFVYCATGKLTLHKADGVDNAELKVASEDGEIVILGSWDADNEVYKELAVKEIKCFFRYISVKPQTSPI